MRFVKSLLVSCPQVINIINAAQESSPVTVAEALERVLEILRTTELYSPQLASKEDDPHTNDLVGGLMSVRHRCSLTPQTPPLAERSKGSCLLLHTRRHQHCAHRCPQLVELLCHWY